MPPNDPTGSTPTSVPSQPRIAWLGLGLLGRAMVTRLVKQEAPYTAPLTIYNRTVSRAHDLEKALPPNSVRVATTIPEAIAAADTIFILVWDDSAVREVLREAISTGIRDKLIVDCTTVSAQTTVEIETLVRDAGGHFLAMPVFGGPPAAEGGNLICLPSGPAEAIARIRPLVKCVSRAAIEQPNQPPEKAALLKILGNSIMSGVLQSVSEGHVLAEKCELGMQPIHRFVELFLPGPFTAFSQRMVNGDYFRRQEPLSRVDNALKDSEIALELARKNEAQLRNVETGYGQFRKLKEYATQEGIEADLIQTYGIARMDAGLPFRNAAE